ncbi:MAG: ABC transporter substrate-binding protein [Spirochaetaceae bacterium]|jgi:osmoprotectant transport system substrate-binding protein|nr:ABC transporter substrate-binding protein [Spirochaetaceae bacterium]
MKKNSIIIILLCIGVSFSPLFAGGKQEQPLDKKPVVVASKIDTEGALLGNMIVQVLENAGIPVENRTEFGTTDVIRKAIMSGEIDIYPEYTGNGAFFYEGSDSAVWKDLEKGYETIKKLDYDAGKIVWLRPAPANNTWAIAIRKDLSNKEGIKTLSDLAAYANKGGVIKLAGSEEFVSRPDSLPAFEAAYQFHLEKGQLLILSGGNTATTEKAAGRGTDGVNLAMAYGTDGQLAALGLLVLEDNMMVQPVYAPAPIIREAVLNLHRDIEKLLKPVFESLDGPTLQRLNSAIAVEGQEASSVAMEYLKSAGFLK